MDKNPLERRSYNFDVETEESATGSVITGRPIVYNCRTNIGGMFDEIIERGALENAE